jgi:RHS repeat-associated protein
MTYEDGTSTPAGDKYSGLDNFGRVVESLWMKGTTVIENVAYGYNRASNRQWRRNQLAHATPGDEATQHDNFYWYDGLYQVVQRQLGNLTGTAPAYTGIDNRQQNEDWCYDPIGNWNHYDNEDDSDLSQSRSHNGANEITSVTNPAGVVQPAYDKVGNQTADIAPGEWDTQYDLKWDAWNRLVEVRDGPTVVQTNAYDGQTRRITSDDGTDTIHYYYNSAWRAVEQYVNAGTGPERRHLWGLRGRWDLVKRERNDGGSLNEKRYVLYDAMDPVAICDGAGAITRRFEYSPFGRVSFMNPDFSAATTPADWDFLFHGEFLDSPTGYYNYGYRFYNTATGRWPSRDPIDEEGGVNLYGFVGNDSLNGLDLLGMKAPHIIFKVAFKGAGKIMPLHMDAGAERAYNSWGEADNAYRDAKTKFDVNKDGKVDEKDCCPCDFRATGYSWGAWSAIVAAQLLRNDKSIDQANLVIRLGLIDPISTARSAGTGSGKDSITKGLKEGDRADGFIAALPDKVQAKNWYQTNGCYGRRCPGPSGYYKSGKVKGATNIDKTATHSLDVPGKNFDHVDMQSLGKEASDYAFK